MEATVVWPLSSLEGHTVNFTFSNNEKHPNATRMGVAFVYAILGAFGVVGNFWTITSVSFQLYQRGCDKRHLLLYILVLSVVDILFVMFIPVLIIDMIYQGWPFDRVLCKLLWSCDSPNKFLSTFLLVALSAHCYIAVCQPDTFKRNFRRRRYALMIIVGSAVISLACMTPVYIYADVWVQGYIENDTGVFHAELRKCLIYAPPDITEAFTLYAFALGFCLTVVLQLLFYGLMLLKLIRHKQQMKQSKIQLGQITKSVLMLVTFYLFCWTPYWIHTLITLLHPDDPPSQLVSVIIHCLPYLNAAFNSTLYLRITRTARDSNVSLVKVIRGRVSAGRSIPNGSQAEVPLKFSGDPVDL